MTSEMDETRPKGFWEGVKRLIIEEPDAAAAEADPFALPREQATASAAATPASEATDVPPVALSGEPLDLAGVYAAAQIPADPSSVERAMALLRDLPQDTPLAAQRSIVRTTLKSFGVDVQELIQDAARKRQALDAHAAAGRQAAEQFRADTEAKIAAFQQEIEQLRADAATQVGRQEALAAQCRAVMAEIDRVVDFFRNESAAAEPGQQ